MHDDNINIIGDGQLGGKASWFVRVKKSLEGVLNNSENQILTESLAFPNTKIITTAIFKDFIANNELIDLIKKIETGQEKNLDLIKKAFLEGQFSEKSKNTLSKILKTMTEPLAVRSSSLLEDQKGASFAGKYKSVFVSNQGSKEDRQKEFLNAIKQVYASTYNANSLAYRYKHGFIEDREEMAILVQTVVGRKYGNYYLPAMAGVGFSQNGYCWNKEIKKHDGLVRLVFGLGTRAVGRGYVRLFSPVKPTMRPEGTEVNNIQKCSQKKVDVIDLENNKLKEVHFRELIKDGFNCFPGSNWMVSLRDGTYLYKPTSNMWDSMHTPVLTMDGVLSAPWMGLNIAKNLNLLLRVLEKELGFAVDVEFAIDADPETKKAKIYLLQARPLSEGEGKKPETLPDLRNEDIIFSVQSNLPTAYVPDIEYLVYLDDIIYHNWPHRDKQSVARVVGKINEALSDKKFALIGPGRWGSWNPDLGVPVNYAEISNCSLLVEIARRNATYVPEVSFGSHFFQDLIEDNIAYLPIYPDEANVVFNESISKKKSEFSKFMSDPYYRQFDNLIKILHVPSIADKRYAHAILNGELEKAVVYLK